MFYMYIVFHKNFKYSVEPKDPERKKCGYLGPLLIPREPRLLHLFSESEWNMMYAAEIDKMMDYVCDQLGHINIDGYDIKINYLKIVWYLKRLLYRTSSNTSKRYYFLK